jgi:hypothetical protein
VYGGQVQIVDGTMTGPTAAMPYASVAETRFSDLAGKVTKVVLTVKGFDHGAARDVDMMLVAPQGERALVMSDVGGATPERAPLSAMNLRPPGGGLTRSSQQIRMSQHLALTMRYEVRTGRT